MKIFTVITVIFAIISAKCLAAPVESDLENGEKSESAARNQKVNEQQQANPQQLNSEAAARYRKATQQQQMYGMIYGVQSPQSQNQNMMMRSAYGGVPSSSLSSIPSAPGPALSYSYQVPAPTVPCAKNLLLSCQPNVVPVPCAPAGLGSSGYGSGPVGAYSEPVPQWILPQGNNYHTHSYGY